MMKLEELKIKLEQEKVKLEGMQLDNEMKVSGSKKGMKKIISEVLQEDINNQEAA